MPLIKQTHSGRMMRDTVVLDMGDLGRQAQRIIAEAQAKADELIRIAKEQVRELVDTAEERGQAQGFEQGVVEGRSKGAQEGRENALAEHRDRLQQLASQWQTAINRWESDRESLVQQSIDDIMQFAVAVAGKVVRRKVETDATIIREQLSEALQLLSKTSQVEIVIHSSDRALVEEMMPQVVATLASCRHAVITTDETLLPGGCIIKTAGGKVDASIETQMSRIVAAMVPDDATAMGQRAQ